ncbi:MAG: DNA polymerase III subunit delta [Candidatus Kryptoniota bacterium]
MSDFNKFLSDVRKRKFARIYLLHGNEDYFISKAVDSLIDIVIEPGERAFNLDVFDGTEITSEEVLTSSLSFPFVGEHRLTIVRRFDKMDKKQRIDIADHLSNLPDTNILSLVAGEIKVSEEPYKKISAIAETITLNKLKGAELAEFVRETARSFGKELRNGTADLLIELTGDSIGDLVSEIEKLSLYVGDAKEINADDVNAAIGKSRAYNIFELQRAIGQRNITRAQEIAGRMIEAGEKPVYINFMLTKYFLNLLQVKHHLQKGTSPNEIASKVFGRWNPFINEYTSSARIYSINEIKRAIATLLDVDSKLKRSWYKDKDAMVITVTEILDSTVPR